MNHPVPGASLHVREFGAGAPVLLVHGFPFSSEMWVPVAERIARKDVRAIVPDLRGFGASSGEPAKGMRTYADDLAALLTGMGIRGAIPWVGFSMGGYVALEAWRRHASQDLGARPRRHARDPRRRKGARRPPRHGGQGRAGGEPGRRGRDAAEAPRRRGTRGVRQSVHASMAAAAPQAVAAALRAMASREDSTATLAAVRGPTLVLVGQEDAITPVKDAEQMAQGISGATLAVLAGAGHLAPLEKPDEVASHLSRWLARKP